MTSTALLPGAGPPPLRWGTAAVKARFDRPSGFLTVHRRSGLVLAAGRVREPEVHPQD